MCLAVDEMEILVEILLLPFIIPRKVWVIPSSNVISVVVGVPLWSESTSNEIHLLVGSMCWSYSWIISNHMSSPICLAGHDYHNL